MCRVIRLQLCLLLVYPIFWFIYFPRDPKFTVTDATLTQFNLTNHNKTCTLDYNLALNITIINPNKNAGIFYGEIQVMANYRNKLFALATLPSDTFGQCGKSSPILHHVPLKGKKLVVFGEREISQFNSETAAGVYGIDVRLYLGINVFTSGKFKTSYSNPSHKIDCKLKVPLQFSETSTNRFIFNTTKCRNDISLQTLKQRAESVYLFLGNTTVQVLITCIYIFVTVRA